MSVVDDTTSEQFRTIPGFDQYKVSSLGRIARYRVRKGGVAEWQFLSGCCTSRGHVNVMLSQDGQRINFHIHRLVLMAFVGSCPVGKEGCHRDGDFSNNRLDNIFWGRPQDNVRRTQKEDHQAKSKRFRIRRIWSGMKARCDGTQKKSFKQYGARGISVCQEWHQFEVFRDWALANGYKDDLTIERKNVNGNYEPGNCCWIPKKDQGRNLQRSVRVHAFGETKLVIDWEKDHRCRSTAASINHRVKMGWDAEKAITTPNWKRPRFVYLEAFGERKTSNRWVKDPRCNVASHTLRRRLEEGWDHELAISTPARTIKHQGMISAFGESKTVVEWAEDDRSTVSYFAILNRIKRGWDPEPAIASPQSSRRPRAHSSGGAIEKVAKDAAPGKPAET